MARISPTYYTWISIFLVTSVVAWLQVVGGAGVGAIPTILGVFVDGVILFYCFRFGTKDVVSIDKLCLTVSIVGVMAYVIFRGHPVLSLAIVTAAEMISFIPTFRKTKNDPYSESLPSYYLLMLKLILVLVALEVYNLLTASYSVLWLTMFVVFLTCTYIWRAQVKTGKRHQKGRIATPVLDLLQNSSKPVMMSWLDYWMAARKRGKSGQHRVRTVANGNRDDIGDYFSRENSCRRSLGKVPQKRYRPALNL